MSNAPTPKTIATATVPGTEVTVTIVRRWVRKSEVHKSLTATYAVTRDANGSHIVNGLTYGRDNLTEARKVANALFVDTVDRRNLDTIKVLAVTDPSTALYRAEAELPHDLFMVFVSWMTDGK